MMTGTNNGLTLLFLFTAANNSIEKSGHSTAFVMLQKSERAKKISAFDYYANSRSLTHSFTCVYILFYMCGVDLLRLLVCHFFLTFILHNKLT